MNFRYRHDFLVFLTKKVKVLTKKGSYKKMLLVVGGGEWWHGL